MRVPHQSSKNVAGLNSYTGQWETCKEWKAGIDEYLAVGGGENEKVYVHLGIAVTFHLRRMEDRCCSVYFCWMDRTGVWHV